jgi:nitrate reductase delta subunit
MDIQEKFKLVSILLRYPSEDMKNAVNEIGQVDDNDINKFLDYFKNSDLMKIQQEYVRSFDLSNKASLYLTYHKFQDDPKRGSYLSKLVDYYRKKGFEFVENELPDFLPIVLEFVSYIDEDTALQVLSSFEKELSQIQKGLKDMNSKYQPLIDFVLHTIPSREVKEND